ncbi:13020_t:CDS:2, partial [Dentiscutata erythropus]
MNNQYCSAHKITPYNLVFGQLPHSETNIADILINDNYYQEELFNTSASNTSASNTSVSNTLASNTSAFDTSASNTLASNTSAFNTLAILETNNINELYDDLSDILDIYYKDFESRLSLEGSEDYYLENFEFRHNLEGSIISNNYYLEDSTISDNYYSKNLKTYKAQSKIIEVDNDLIESNNNIVNLQEIIIISDSESQSYTTQEKQKWQESNVELQKTTSNSTHPIFEQHNKIQDQIIQCDLIDSLAHDKINV